MAVAKLPLFRLCVGMATVLLLMAWAYWPGLSGPFMFDDDGNLDVLGAYGRIDSLPTLLYYLTSGNADPTGRPLALLTFLLDGQAWPAEPWPFKRTNLLLHLLNTGLLAWTLSRLQAALARRQPAGPHSAWTTLLGAALWGAHPFFVSTTLYVVQREAMLPMTFVLLALLTWDTAVRRFSQGRGVAGWSWALVGFGGATLLAGLSKANGFLAPLLVGLAYLWMLRPTTSSIGQRWRPMDTAALLCLALPSSLLLGYLLYVGLELWPLHELTGRDWTLPERLMSEPRALWSYVFRLAIPRAGGGGVFVDDFATSRSWLDPATTLPAMLTLAASAALAIVYRRRYAIASFAWVFFLGANLLESTTIPLELYFEHRSYLSAAFLGWPLAHALLRPGTSQRLRATFAILLLAVLLLLTHQRAAVWGNPALLGALSAKHATDSARAQVNAATQEISGGNVRAGLERMHAAQRAHPGSVDIAISAIGMECAATGALSAVTLTNAKQTLSTVRNWNYGLYEWMHAATKDSSTLMCRGFGLPGLTSLVASAETNPQSRENASRERDLWHVRGRIALAQQRPDLALHWFDAALLTSPDTDYALVQAAALGAAGAPELGLQHLDRHARAEVTQRAKPIRDMRGLHTWLLRRYGYYDREVLLLRRQLASDAHARSEHP